MDPPHLSIKTNAWVSTSLKSTVAVRRALQKPQEQLGQEAAGQTTASQCGPPAAPLQIKSHQVFQKKSSATPSPLEKLATSRYLSRAKHIILVSSLLCLQADFTELLKHAQLHSEARFISQPSPHEIAQV